MKDENKEKGRSRGRERASRPHELHVRALSGHWKRVTDEIPYRLSAASSQCTKETVKGIFFNPLHIGGKIDLMPPSQQDLAEDSAFMCRETLREKSSGAASDKLRCWGEKNDK